jgi:hypothetical protein
MLVQGANQPAQLAGVGLLGVLGCNDETLAIVNGAGHGPAGELQNVGHSIIIPAECLPCNFNHSWNLPVSNGISAVHCSGQPITHSSKAGELVFPIGFPPRHGLLLPPHSSSRPTTWFFPLRHPLGVGSKYPDSVSEMRGADTGRSQHSPFRIEPHRGQVCKNSSEPPRSEHWAVFQEDSSRFNLVNDPSALTPQSAALVIEPGALAGRTDALAGEPRRYHVNMPVPRSSVKTCNVRPNRERAEASIVLPLHQNLCGVGITFNCAAGVPSKEFSAEYTSSSACEKSQLIHVSPLPDSTTYSGFREYHETIIYTSYPGEPFFGTRIGKVVYKNHNPGVRGRVAPRVYILITNPGFSHIFAILHNNSYANIALQHPL